MVPLQHGRCALQVDPRRDEPHLHARREGRGADDRLRRARDRQRREPRTRTRASSGRSRDRRPGSSRPASRRSPACPRRVRRSQVSAGSWSPTPATIAYQWQRCNANGRLCKPLPGATASTYAVTAADTGHALRRGRPRDGGSRIPGRGQRCDSRGRHRPDDGPVEPRAARQWPGRASRANSSRARPDTGRARARSATATSGTAATRRARTASRSTAPRGRPTRSSPRTSARRSASPSMPPMPRVPPRPTRASSARLREPTPPSYRRRNRRSPASPGRAQTLQVSDGTWNQKPASLTYAWQRCNPNGRLCVPIAGATAATYAVTAADAGHALVALVQAHGEGRLAGDPQRRHRGRLLRRPA